MAQLQSTGITGSLTVTGNITAQEFHTEYVSSSILHESGSTSFGNTSDDVHNFTGSLNVQGSINATSGYGHGLFERVHINNLQSWSAQDLGSASSGSIAFRINGRSGATNDFIIHSNGTTNYTMQVVGNAETSGQLHINPFGGNVGIGTTSPSEKLEVAGNVILDASDARLKLKGGVTGTNSGIDWTFNTDSTKYARVDLDYDTRASVGLLIDSGYPITLDFSSGRFAIQKNGSEKMRIDSDGNVGIGTDNPIQKLHIHNTATLTATYQKFTNGTATTGTTLGIDADGDFLINNGEDKQIKLYTNDEQRLTILSGGNVGIGNTNPVNAKLLINSGTSDGENTVKIVHTRNDSNVPTRALQIDMALSGADNTDADRTHYGLHVDLDSSADGDISNEHRIYGVASDVRFTGFSDIVRGAWFHAESNNITENTAQLVGTWGEAIHDSELTAGGVTNMYGMYGLSSVQDKGDVGSSFGGFFNTNITSTRTENIGVTKGVQGEVTIDANTANLTYGEMIAVMAVIDNNEGAVPDFGDQYLFKGDYQGTKGDNAWGLHVEGDKHYLSRRLFLGTTSPDTTSIFEVRSSDAERFVRFRTSNDEERFIFHIGGTGNGAYLDIANSSGITQTRFRSTGDSYILGGNVGIGTSAPVAKLDVKGKTLIGSVGARSTNGLTVGYSSTATFAANADISDANRTVSIVNDTNDTDNTYASLGFRISPTTDTSMGDLKFVRTGDNANSLIWTAKHGATFHDRFTIKSDGNVGIGTTDPTGKLEISQQLSAASTIDYPVIITSRDDGNSLNQQGGEGVGIKFRLAGNSSNDPGDSLVGASIAAIREEAGDTDSSTGLGFFISQNNETLDEAVRIDHNGSVGIGTTPFTHGLGTSVNLDLLGNGGIWGYAGATYVNSNAYYDSGWKYKSANPAAVLQVGGSSPHLSFRQAASGTADGAITYTQPFMINSSGYVGISTTSPQGSLHVYSGTSERLLVGGDVSIKGATDLQIDGTSRRVSFNAGTGTVRTSTANSLFLATNNTTALTINSSQDATFAEDLTVNGEFTFNGGNVQGNVAYTVDMSNTSTFAEDTYYPVTIPLTVGRETELRIEVPLNSGDDPSYATHSSGVSLYLKWSAIGNGWGTNYGHRTVYEWDERYSSVTLVGGITQMNNGSVEVVYLRGGMTYFFFANRSGLSITPRSSTYTNNSQSVSPTTSIVNDPMLSGIGKVGINKVVAKSVGIGTSSPDGKLEVSSDSSLSSYVTQYTTDTDGAELVIRTARGTQASPAQYVTGDSAGRLLFQAYTSTGAFKDAASIESVMESGNANAYGGLRFNYMPDTSPYTLREGMKLNTSGEILIPGEVGIGTTSVASGKLVISGDPYVITNSGQAQGGIDLKTNAAVGSGVFGAAISFGTVGSGRAAISSVQGSSDADRQGLVFFTHGSGTGAADSAEAMRISHDGKVGIASPSPAALLDVSDRVYIDTYSSEASGNNPVISGYMRIRAGAKTGWGADDQLGKIEFYGADTSGAGARTAASILAVCETGNGTSTTTFSSGLAFYTSPYNAAQVERIRISRDGKVGIGTTTPAVPLHVNGANVSIGTIGTPKSDWYNTSYNSLQIGEGTTLWGRAGDSHFSGNYYVNTGGSGGAAQDTYINALSAHDFWLDNSSGSLKYRNAPLGGAGNAISWSTRFVVLNNGNFGIGTTSPVETLTVPGGKGAMLGYKKFYSDGGTVPGGVGTSYTLTANLNDEHGTTLTSQHQYKFYLTTTGTGTYNSSVYIVYRNSADNAWVVHRVSSTGLTSNHPELTVSGDNALIYNDHPNGYGVKYRVETTYSGQAKTSPEIFGTDFMWTKDNTDLYYMGGDVGIGLSNPTTNLHVLGDVRFDSHSTGDPDSTSTAAYPAPIMFTHYSEANGVSIIGGQGAYTGCGLTIGEETGRSSNFKFIKAVSDTNGGANASEEFWINGVGDAYFAGKVGIGTTSPATSAKLSVMGNQTFGIPANGANASSRFLSIEGNADSAGEGSARIFFSEHNSTTAAVDKYGMSLGYRGGATTITGASGNDWDGLGQIGNGQWGMWGHNDDASGDLIMYGDRAATYVIVDGILRATGDVVAYYSSDRTLKDNLVKINNPLSKINKLSGYYFNWNDKQDTYEAGSRDIGIVAQEVEEVLPEIVQTRKNGHKAVKYEKLVALLVEGMKEQQETIDKLEDRIKKLENR